MKICSTCGATYTDRIDFCFNDGSILAARPAAGADTAALDVPIPQNFQGQTEEAAAEPPVRARRSVIQAAAPAPQANGNDGEGFAEPLQPMAVEPAVAEVQFEDEDDSEDPTPEPRPLPKRTTPAHDPISPSSAQGDDAIPWIEPPPPLPAAPADAPPPPAAGRPTNATLVPDFYAAGAMDEEPETGEPPPEPEAIAAPSPGAAARRTSSVDDDEPPPAGRSWLVPALVGGSLLIVVGGGAILVAVGLGGFALSGSGDEAAAAAVKPAAVATTAPPVEAVREPEAPPEAADSDAAPTADDPPPEGDGEIELAAEEPHAEEPPPVEPAPVASEAEPAQASGTAAPATSQGTAGTATAATPKGSGSGTASKAPADTTTTATAAVVVPAEGGGTGEPAVKTSRVTIESTPPGATVKVDGEAKGQTPLTLDLAYGGYIVELALDGHTTARKTVDVAQPNVKVPVTLDRKIVSGKVFVALQGRDGQTLLIDGKEVGPLPVTVDLVEGEHTFAVDNGDGTQFQVTREVTFTNGRAVINL